MLLLDGRQHDLAALLRAAVDDSADLLGVAGGDSALAQRKVLISDNPYGTGNDVPQRAIPVAIDGESTLVEAPMGCRVRSGSLRVRVPRERPGAALSGQLVALPWLAR